MNQQAGEGEVFVCQACGKRSKDLYGEKAFGSWDESCMMNAILCKESSVVFHPNGMVIKADPVEESEPTITEAKSGEIL